MRRDPNQAAALTAATLVVAASFLGRPIGSVGIDPVRKQGNQGDERDVVRLAIRTAATKGRAEGSSEKGWNRKTQSVYGRRLPWSPRTPMQDTSSRLSARRVRTVECLRAAVSEAMKGSDAVISVLGAGGPVIAEAARAIVTVAKQEGPERIVMMSSFAVEHDRLTPVTKLVTRLAMAKQIKDKVAAEEVLRASGLDWTIVYATQLTNGPKTEPRVVSETTKVGMSQKISRATVASFLLQVTTDGLYSRRGVLITG